MAFQDLKIYFFLSIVILVIGRDRGRTLMARELPGSSSNLYSVPGSSTLILELPELLVDIETKYHADKERRYSVMNFGCYAPEDASNGSTQRWSGRTGPSSSHSIAVAHTGTAWQDCVNETKRFFKYSINLHFTALCSTN